MPTALLALTMAVGTTPAPALPAGTWTNEEDAYFAAEGGKRALPWIGIKVTADGAVASVDAFGQPVPPAFKSIAPEGENVLRAALADGRTTVLRRARPVTCWAALRRDPGVITLPDEWHFVRDIKLHDQGGRATVGESEPNVQPVILRLRNVAWPSGPNRPSLVLYVHTPESPESALSYVWADPGAVRLGINLRWMQASCTIEGMEPPAPPAGNRT